MIQALALKTTHPEDALVKLPDHVSYETAARFGYLGTAYAAMKTLGVGPGQTFLVNGVSGMLGLNAVMLALAMGTPRILGIGRNRALLDRVKVLSPQRIEIYSVDESMPVGPDDPLVPWAKSMTEGYGVDCSLDCLPPGASADVSCGLYSHCAAVAAPAGSAGSGRWCR